MDFERACMVFTMQEPYYGILLSSMNRFPTDKIETIGVCRTGNVFRLAYNPAYIESLGIDEITTLLKHEVLHIAFQHFDLWDSPTSNYNEKTHRNIAEDMEINGYLDENIVRKLEGVLPSAIGADRYLGSREYYKLLGNKSEEEQKRKQASDNSGIPGECIDSDSDGQDTGDGNNQQNSQQSNSNSSENNKSNLSVNQQSNSSGHQSGIQSRGNGFSTPSSLKNSKILDDHSNWPTENDTDLEMLKQEVDELLVYAAEEVEKACGSVPGEMKVRIDEIKKRKPRPVTDWKRYMRRYLGNEFTELIKKSRKRESRRFPDAQGNRHQRKSKVLVAVDTSGSVSMPEYMEFFGQIKTLTEKASFTVLECDTEIAYQYEFKGKIPTDLHGGGGRNMCLLTQ